MSAARPEVAFSHPPIAIGRHFDETIAFLNGLSQALDRLDQELLSGRPHAIAEATMMLESGLADSDAIFAHFRKALAAVGDGRLSVAARHLHQGPRPELGSQLDRIEAQLLSIIRRSDAGLRRAEALTAGLSSSLHALRALDALSSDQLLAEA